MTTDEPVDPAFWADYEGRKIYFCCRKCRTEFLNNPGEYLANLPAVAPDESEAPAVDADANHAGHGAHDHGGHDTVVAAPGIEEPGAMDGGHDHSSHSHGDAESELSRVIGYMGKFHPILVHFPIALLLVALLAEVLHMATKRVMFETASRFLVPLAAFSALVAAGFGWMAGESASYTGDLADTLLYHRWVGVSVATIAALTAILQWVAARRDRPALRWAYRLMLVIVCVLVSIAGHLGATLIYGVDYFSF